MFADGGPISAPRPNIDCSERPSVAAAEPASRRAANSGTEKKPSRNGVISEDNLSAVASGPTAKDSATATTTRSRSARSASAKTRAKAPARAKGGAKTAAAKPAGESALEPGLDPGVEPEVDLELDGPPDIEGGPGAEDLADVEVLFTKPDEAPVFINQWIYRLLFDGAMAALH